MNYKKAFDKAMKSPIRLDIIKTLNKLDAL